mmetsp:Transcript_29577/g.65147  ORF Transcript_29577/g.65147 Transcript_29577/m.65147 type:complete len:871 (-) Transcript_29577:92-2704(-)
MIDRKYPTLILSLLTLLAPAICSEPGGHWRRHQSGLRAASASAHNPRRTAEAAKGTRKASVTPILEGQSALQFVDWNAPVLGTKLKECQGDCDRDADCEGNLQCWGTLKTQSSEKVPGCGKFRYEENGVKPDYCYDPNKASSLADLPEHSDTLLYVGRDVGAFLGRCQGDCRVNRDCRGDLECYEGEGANVPGCGGIREAKVDYCYDPKWKEAAKDGGEEGGEEEEEEAITGDIFDDLISLDEIEWFQDIDNISNDTTTVDTGSPPLAPPDTTPYPSKRPTQRPTRKPTRAPSSHPTHISKEEATEESLNITPGTTLEESNAAESPAAADDTNEPNVSTEEPIDPTEDESSALIPDIPTTAHPSPSPTLPLGDTDDKIAVPLPPFILVLEFYTPQRRTMSRHVRMLRSLVIKENLDEDDTLLRIVATLIGERLRSIYSDEYFGLIIDADFVSEEEVDAVTSAAYSFSGQALFSSDDTDFVPPSRKELVRVTEDALNEDDLLEELLRSDDIILELTAGTGLIIDSSAITVPEEGQEEVIASSEHPPPSGGMSRSVKIFSIVLCSILGATALGLLGGYFYIRRQERKDSGEYELDESGSDGELHRASRKIIGALPSPLRPKGTFDTQECSPSPHSFKHEFEEAFEEAEVPDLSLPDLDAYSVGVESCDWSYGGEFPARMVSKNSVSAYNSLRGAPDPYTYSSSASLASESVAEEAHASEASEASSAIASASVVTGTLTNTAALGDSGRRHLRPRGDQAAFSSSYDGQNSLGGNDSASTDDGLDALGGVKLSSVLQMDEATVASKSTLNFNHIWRHLPRKRTPKVPSIESNDTDSAIEYKGHSSSEDEDITKDHAYSFDKTTEKEGEEEDAST